MTSLEILGLITIILVSIFSLIGIIVSVPLIKLLSRIRVLAENLTESILPVIENLKNTVEKLNSEISEINEITKSASSIVSELEKIVKLARVVVTSPVIKIISAFAGIISTFSKESDKTKSRIKEGKNE
jgi:molecular chaperone GrpE (heat shock protein)